MSTTIPNTTSPLFGSTTTPAPATSSATLGKDAFMKLLVAQLSHQDPLQPQDGSAFVAQLAQFSAVEQAQAQTQKLDLLSQQLASLGSNAAVNLVGKQVSIQAKQIAFDGVTATGASVTLSGAAAKVTVQIQDASGHVVRTMQVGARPAGAMPVVWDGRDDNGQTVPPGSYGFAVTATDPAGSTVAVSQQVTGNVSKVSYDKGYPELLLDSGATAPISDLISVGTTSVLP